MLEIVAAKLNQIQVGVIMQFLCNPPTKEEKGLTWSKDTHKIDMPKFSKFSCVCFHILTLIRNKIKIDFLSTHLVDLILTKAQETKLKQTKASMKDDLNKCKLDFSATTRLSWTKFETVCNHKRTTKHKNSLAFCQLLWVEYLSWAQ